ncbi:hypothetical protein, variant 2 [Verruconis gallopava]|uniref:Heterokaryon incompatibility domain-containing protein n=1 Tax=Verruconis gallopava TaxID=253628 RepID=A0A0D1XZ66_9PEZI|nr:uncharacterized protein PV09_01029 [Verruconis gallopava]XP_016217959.1 hypothetical protein, variant 1 [Verruconis gallopava]XP_016217960.1 hypothetical protein, variant 2 [Verruconis gallopava]KIW08089.1 hypothetical protein PV09_01029 [Verruconis gallopava]KIW08090.1 hypothetical protein, variant 1 [Verruconis gallopava]KIW08091.1 hypothetical protein, variant 2 [Verruconis gallopava]
MAAGRTESPRFEFPELSSEGSYIRLIKPLPVNQGGENSHEIRFEMIVADLDMRPVYKAVSYTWGPPTPVGHVTINNQRIQIRENLFILLRMLSTTHKSEAECPLWIDQICIDQSNVLERNHQVAQMARVYEQATQVLVWLGPGTIDSDVLLDSMNALWHHHRPISNDDIVSLQKQFTRSKCLRLSYWSRLWVVQEILLASDITVLWGSRRIAWETARSFFLGFRESGRPIAITLPSSGRLLSRDHLRNLIRGRDKRIEVSTRFRGKLTWDQALYFSARTECEDPRDRIYGLLGLVSEEFQIKPDYTKSFDEVFDELEQLIRSKHDLGPISSSLRPLLNLPPKETR